MIANTGCIYSDAHEQRTTSEKAASGRHEPLQHSNTKPIQNISFIRNNYSCRIKVMERSLGVLRVVEHIGTGVLGTSTQRYGQVYSTSNKWCMYCRCTFIGRETCSSVRRIVINGIQVSLTCNSR